MSAMEFVKMQEKDIALVWEGATKICVCVNEILEDGNFKGTFSFLFDGAFRMASFTTVGGESGYAYIEDCEYFA